MFKFGTIGMFQHAINNPRVKCASAVKNGYAFTIDDNGSNYKEEAIAFADAATAKTGNVWVALNIVDEPELANSTDFEISIGEPINSFKLDSLVGKTVEISSDLVTTAYASVAVDDVLVPVPAGAGAMKWVKDAAPSGITCALRVLEKTTFGGTGLYCKIVKV